MNAYPLLRQLVAIPSTFPNEERMARFCAVQLRKAGCRVKLQRWRDGAGKTRYNVLATKGRAKQYLLLYGHHDTVPPYNYHGNPHRLTQQGDAIHGLGCWDMKAGIALIIDTVRQLKPSAKIGIKVALGADEENISEGAHRIAQSGFFDTCVLAIVPEIVDTEKVMRHAPLVLGRRGRTVYRVMVQGIGAHGASTKGISAIDLAVRIQQSLRRLRLPRHRFLGPCRIFMRELHAASTSLAAPVEATLELDVHYVPPLTAERLRGIVLHHITTALRSDIRRGAHVSIAIPQRRTPYLKPYDSSTHSNVRTFLRLLQQSTPRLLRIAGGMTVADENVIAAAGIPCITWGPLGGEPHSAQEWVSYRSFRQLEQQYPAVLQQLLDGSA